MAEEWSKDVTIYSEAKGFRQAGGRREPASLLLDAATLLAAE